MDIKEMPRSASTSNGRKVLVLGGTGAMGVYLVPELASRGYEVCVVSLDDAVSDNPRISHVKADGTDVEILKKLLAARFDAIIDFLMYPGDTFRARHALLLENTSHYVYLSSYRVYDGIEVPVRETSPRLLDNSNDEAFLATDDYALFKARGEDVLQHSSYDNWTIVRPAITYSKRRFQLVTLEAPIVVARALKGLPVVLPEEALSVPATMTWAGDVARMFTGILFNPRAFREAFTLATAEHRTWGEIADYYQAILGLNYVAVPAEDYLQILGGSPSARYQLAYDRLFSRVIDNSKILRVAGLEQADLMMLQQGLTRELTALPQDLVWPDATATWRRMDAYLRRDSGK